MTHWNLKRGTKQPEEGAQNLVEKKQTAKLFFSSGTQIV